MEKDIVINKFFYKCLYILKAASDGWIVKYIGGNKYDFLKIGSELEDEKIMPFEEFINDIETKMKPK
jgi:hypothetical protein